MEDLGAAEIPDDDDDVQRGAKHVFVLRNVEEGRKRRFNRLIRIGKLSADSIGALRWADMRVDEEERHAASEHANG